MPPVIIAVKSLCTRHAAEPGPNRPGSPGGLSRSVAPSPKPTRRWTWASIARWRNAMAAAVRRRGCATKRLFSRGTSAVGRGWRGTAGDTRMTQRKFAIVTGASSGIGYELAKIAAREGYDLLIAADEPLVDASSAFRNMGVEV